MSEIPQDFHQLNYSRKILDDLGLPAKGNLELVADCIEAFAKSKRIPLHEAYAFIWERCERATKRGTLIDRWWFQNGTYRDVEIDPVFRPTFQKVDPVKTKEEQESKEWLASSLKARTLLAQIASGEHKRPTNSKEKLKAQAAELMRKRGTVPTEQQPTDKGAAITGSTPTQPG